MSVVSLVEFASDEMGVADGRGVTKKDWGLALAGDSAEAAGVMVTSGVPVARGSIKKMRTTPW